MSDQLAVIDANAAAIEDAGVVLHSYTASGDGHRILECDFRRLHRMGLIACHYRAAEWLHKEIELAAHELLHYLDQVSASRRGGAA
jgi:hypothetical protein